MSRAAEIHTDMLKVLDEVDWCFSVNVHTVNASSAFIKVLGYISEKTDKPEYLVTGWVPQLLISAEAERGPDLLKAVLDVVDSLRSTSEQTAHMASVIAKSLDNLRVHTERQDKCAMEVK